MFVKIPTLSCPQCHEVVEIEVPTAGIEAYANGEFIQKAFPDLTPEERERFMSGFCPKCWDELFPADM